MDTTLQGKGDIDRIRRILAGKVSEERKKEIKYNAKREHRRITINQKARDQMNLQNRRKFTIIQMHLL